MKKSKHYRKDVILARVIAAAILILLIALLCFGISLLIKSAGGDESSQNSQQNSQNSQDVNLPVGDSQNPGSENEDVQVPNTEDQNTEDSSDENDDTTTVVPDGEKKTYLKTTGQLRFRAEPNTKCDTLEYLDEGEKLELVEKVNKYWYKAIYNGQEGYVNSAYVEEVEE